MEVTLGSVRAPRLGEKSALGTSEEEVEAEAARDKLPSAELADARLAVDETLRIHSEPCVPTGVLATIPRMRSPCCWRCSFVRMRVDKTD